MNLTEALILRADYQKRIDQLKQRILRNAKAQEGEKPSEDPMELMEELEEVAKKLEKLIQQINRTNATTVVKDGQTLADMLATRDQKRLLQGIYRDLAEAATVTIDRWSRAEIKSYSTVDVKAIHKRADTLAKEYRELDMEIQAANWNTELKE